MDATWEENPPPSRSVIVAAGAAADRAETVVDSADLVVGIVAGVLAHRRFLLRTRDADRLDRLGAGRAGRRLPGVVIRPRRPSSDRTSRQTCRRCRSRPTRRRGRRSRARRVQVRRRASRSAQLRAVLLRLRARRAPRQRRLLRASARRATATSIEWEPHGLECAVCLDVAHDAHADVRVGRVGHATSARRSRRSGPPLADAHADADARTPVAARSRRRATALSLPARSHSIIRRGTTRRGVRAAVRSRPRRRVHRDDRSRRHVDDRRQSPPQADLRLRRAKRPRPTSGRSIASASSIRRRASRCSSG